MNSNANRPSCRINRSRRFFPLVLVAILFTPTASRGLSSDRLAFTLPSIGGENVSIGTRQSSSTERSSTQSNDQQTSRASELYAICFLGTECPMARSYAGRLNELQRDFESQGVKVIGVFSNSQDSPDEVRKFVSEHDVIFQVAVDEQNRVADQFAANRTPEAFLLDADLKLRYHGRIDDQYAPGVAKSSPTREDLRAAIEELLSGKRVSIPETEPLGCIIGRVPSTMGEQNIAPEAITYSEHIAPVLQRNCVECHRSGEIGPFAMNNYSEVVGWAETMMEVIDNGRMPPWHADPHVGEFANARIMPEEDKQMIRKWIDEGLIEGDRSLLPPPLDFVDGWQLQQKPDQIVAMRDRPFEVPRDGVVEYQYFVADPGFTEDKWISAAQVVPGSRAVVHHAIVFVRPPDGSKFSGVGWLTAYVPGQRIRPMPPGRARLIPAGSKLVFQMHYTPIGRPQEDLTQIGLVFTDPDSVTHEVYTTMAIDQQFEIPPNASNYSVDAKLNRLPKNGELLAVTPHMHYRGKSFELYMEPEGADTQMTATSQREGGETATTGTPLLNVPAYDFNWQHTYLFENPIPTKEISSLRFRATFDNSKKNPFNPDPSEWVTWGDQTWEEMAVAFFEVSEPLEIQGETSSSSSDSDSDKESSVAKADTDETRRKIEQYVARVMKELDRNGDGTIQRSETDIVVRRIGFRYWDENGDDVVTREEVTTIAEKLFR